MTDDAKTSPPKHTGGKWRKGLPGNPGGITRVAVQPAQPQPENSEGKRDTRFKIGNPGKPKGARHRATRAIEAMLEGEANAITRKAIELAKAGDLIAIRICLDRLIAPRKERPVSFALPEIKTASDIVGATNAIAAAVASGELMTGEASNLSSLVANVGKAIELGELETRLALIEERLAAGGGQPNAIP
jgi:hypothetical protein